MKKIKNVNLRCSGLDNFWSYKYNESCYLFKSSLHAKTYEEIVNDKTPFIKDIFISKEDFSQHYKFCKQIYPEIMQKLTSIMNDMHSITKPLSFYEMIIYFFM